MEEAAIIEQLILFGLSRQEAVIYLCLLQNEELTGYEVAKLTGGWDEGPLRSDDWDCST